MFGSKPKVADFIRKVERLAKKGLPNSGPLSSETTELLRFQLTDLLKSMNESGERAAGHRALGYLEGLRHIDNLEHQDVVLSLVPVAMARNVESGWENGPGTSDQVLSNVYFLLGREYLQFAKWELSAEFFYHAIITGSNREINRHAGLLSLICASHVDSEIYDLLRPNFDDVNDDVTHAVSALDAIRGKASLQRDPAWYSSIWKLGTLPAALLIEQVATQLNTRRHHREVLVLTQDAMRRIGNEAEYDWLRASILQASAVARVGLGTLEEAITDAEECWRLSERLRYGNCDHVMRESAWSRFLVARTVALEATVRLSDSERLAGFLQRDRLRASLTTRLEASDAEKGVVASGITVPTEEPAALDAESNAGGSAPGALFTALGDAWNATELSPPEETVGSTTLDHIPWWLGIARYGSNLFWTVLRHGIGIDCGWVDLTNTTLGDVLLDLESDITGRERPDGQLLNFDPFYHLAEWGTAEERIMTGALGGLLPPPVVAALNNLVSGDPMELVLAAGAGLQGVPWPIIQIGNPDTGGFRLIERARIRHWLSQDADSHRARFVPPSGRDDLKLLVVIDDPEDNLRGRCDFLRENALSYFSGTLPPTDSPKQAIKAALYEHCSQPISGIFFYRGHAQSPDNPSHVRIPVPRAIEPPDDLDELVFSAGEFFGRFDNGSRFLPLPSRVILSCCSSSSESLFGGEALGLAAACLIGGGAQEVIATGRDVLDCSFTSAFDDMLAEYMTDPAAHDAVLQNLQLRMYDEWRTYSVRGGIEVGDDIRFPHPLIWAMYQAI